MICLLPWKEEPHNYGAFEIYYYRRDLNNKIHAQVIFDTGNGKYYISAWSVIFDDSFYSFEEAATVLDNFLAHKYYLIPENEIERFKEKLIVLV